MPFLLDSLKAILLGLIQGLTGWLPVSGRAHILLVQSIWPIKPEVLFTFLRLVIPLGSYLAVILVFLPQYVFRKKQPHFWRCLILAAIPIFTIGLILLDWLNSLLSSKFVVAVFMCATGAILILSNRLHAKKKKRMHDRNALIAGLIESVALIPGISWMAAGLFSAYYLKDDKKEGIVFSILSITLANLALSVVKITTFYQDGFVLGSGANLYIVLGILSAFFASVFILRNLMIFYKKQAIHFFGVYQIILGALMIFFYYIL